MRARLRFEYEAQERLHQQGFWVARSAGSRGPWDLFAINGQECRLVQVKSTRRPFHPSTVSMVTNAIEELRAAPSPVSTSHWIALKVLRGPWIECRVDDWPMSREDVRDRVRAAIQDGMTLARDEARRTADGAEAAVQSLERERDEARTAAAKALTWTGMEEALATIERLRALLREVEWIGAEPPGVCHWCYQFKGPNNEQQPYGHAPDCRLAAALREEE